MGGFSFDDKVTLYTKFKAFKKHVVTARKRGARGLKDPLLAGRASLTRNIEDVMKLMAERGKDYCRRLDQLEHEEDPAELLESICNEFGVRLEREPSSWICEVWFNLFRLRQAFFLMCMLAIFSSCFTGLLMEVFFSIMFGDNFRFSPLRRCFTIWSLPFSMMLLAMLGDGVCNLIMDSLHFPALHVFQATVLTARQCTSKPCVDLSVVKEIDYLTWFIFEGVPILAVPFSFMFPMEEVNMFAVVTRLMEGYLQGSLVAAILCMFVFVVCNLIVSWRSWFGNARIRMHWIAAKIDEKKMKPYCLHKGFKRLRVKDDPDRRQDQPEEDEADTPWQCPERHCMPILVAIAAVILWTVVAGYSTTAFSKGFDVSVTWDVPEFLGSVLAFAVGACSWLLRCYFPKVVGAPYTLLLILMVVLGGGVTWGSAVQVGDGGTMEAIMSVHPEHLPDSELPARWLGAVLGQPRPYPLCGMTWGSPNASLKALDLASLAWIVYDQDDGTDSMSAMLNKSFPSEKLAELVHAEGYDEIPRWGHFHFPAEAGAEGGGTRVIAVKGTSTVMDALLDTNLFSTVKLLQLFDVLLPVLTIMPRIYIQWLLWEVHLRTAWRAQQPIWQNLEHNVSQLMKEHPGDTFVMTGHSLGGGLAQIVASKLNISAVVWSAPGVAYSARRFGVEVQAVKRSVVSVVPDHDFVPRVDLQAAMLQQIECRTKNGNEAAHVGCHSLVKTTCEVWRVCGDVDARDFRRSCGSKVKKEYLGKLFGKDDYLGY